MTSIETDLPRLLAAADVPGAAAVIIQENRAVRYVCSGMRGSRSPAEVDEHTVFEAASLSKPVFAHAILQLADQGVLALEAPLGEYLPNYIPRDPRASSITASDVLCHRSGLPNWRGADLPLKTYFEPRDRFSYSGEGYLYLQEAVEAITGEKIHTLIDRLVLKPLAMIRSSFIWHPRLDHNRAYAHDAFGNPALRFKPAEANAAWSLQTTAADFSRFLLAVLNGWGLQPETVQLWLRPHVKIRHPSTEAFGPRSEDIATGLAWGLGWGLEIDAGTFFHWGDNGPFTAFTIGSIRDRGAFAVFLNGASGLSIMPDLVAHFTSGPRPSLVWLEYEHHDAPVRRLLRAARVRGIEEVWQAVTNANLEPAALRWIAQGLGATGREADSVWLRARIEERSPSGGPES